MNALRVLQPDAGTPIPESVTALFHCLNRVVPEDQDLEHLTVHRATKVAEAIQLMIERQVSQLAVVEGKEVLGLFSFRSLANAVLEANGDGQCLGNLTVEDCIDVRPPYARVNDDFQPCLQHLARADCVLLGEPSRLQAIVTTFDLLRYLYRTAIPFVHLAEIEQSLRRLIALCFGEAELRQMSEQYRTEKYRMASRLEEMVFANYVKIIDDDRNWPTLQPIFGGSKVRIVARLKRVHELRNIAFHFSRDLCYEDRKELADCRNWLHMKARGAEALAKGGMQ
ncbi:MAG: CBS domain-containing protein [Rhodopirellula sp.]|nr:CBS domain-containing protein [Rhodopirellula sp.]